MAQRERGRKVIESIMRGNAAAVVTNGNALGSGVTCGREASCDGGAIESIMRGNAAAVVTNGNAAAVVTNGNKFVTTAAVARAFFRLPGPR